ncbi:MAG: dihydropteroate synthase, partial [Dongiaceae bacterium]
FRACQHTFTFPRPALILGIVNVTPDSFSDGGQFLDPRSAVEHALALAAQGADLIDVGGESTRPGATPVSEAEEMRRVLPVIERLAGELKAPISIDTMKPAVARAALRAGACIVNDIAANRADPAMWRVVAEAGAGYVAMHMQGTPQTMQQQPAYDDVVGEVNSFFGDRLARLQEAGVSAEQLVLDPGLGFGKTAEHNLQLLAAIRSFTIWNRPLLLGASRKSFLGRFAGNAAAAARLPASLACACWAVAQGVNIIRAHEVEATRQAVRLTEALLAACRSSNHE